MKLQVGKQVILGQLVKSLPSVFTEMDVSNINWCIFFFLSTNLPFGWQNSPKSDGVIVSYHKAESLFYEFHAPIS